MLCCWPLPPCASSQALCRQSRRGSPVLCLRPSAQQKLAPVRPCSMNGWRSRGRARGQSPRPAPPPTASPAPPGRELSASQTAQAAAAPPLCAHLAQQRHAPAATGPGTHAVADQVGGLASLPLPCALQVPLPEPAGPPQRAWGPCLRWSWSRVTAVVGLQLGLAPSRGWGCPRPARGPRP